jgi:hypothetical protein
MTTTEVVHQRSWWDAYRRHGYFFREAATLTILIGFGLHLYRVIFGNDLTQAAHDRAHRVAGLHHRERAAASVRVVRPG